MSRTCDTIWRYHLRLRCITSLKAVPGEYAKYFKIFKDFTLHLVMKLKIEVLNL